MTPSVNRLHDSATALGKYMLECEYDLVCDEFQNTPIRDLEQFKRWVTGYMYYHAVVCACADHPAEINAQLEQDWEELSASA